MTIFREIKEEFIRFTRKYGRFNCYELCYLEGKPLEFETDFVVCNGSAELSEKDKKLDLPIQTSKELLEFLKKLELKFAAIARQGKLNYIWYFKEDKENHMKFSEIRGKPDYLIQDESGKAVSVDKIKKDTVCRLVIQVKKLWILNGFAGANFRIRQIIIHQL